MLAAYHKIQLVERVVLNALERRLRRLMFCTFGDSFVIVLRSRLRSKLRRAKQDDPTKFINFFLFILRFPSVEDGPGGTYLSGQSSNPASHRHLRIDPSTRVGRSFSKFRTCCVGQSCASSIRESRRTEECAASGKTRNLGSQSTSIKAISVRRRPQIIRRSRLRLFRNGLLCSGCGWTNQHSDELNGVSQLR